MFDFYFHKFYFISTSPILCVFVHAVCFFTLPKTQLLRDYSRTAILCKNICLVDIFLALGCYCNQIGTNTGGLHNGKDAVF